MWMTSDVDDYRCGWQGGIIMKDEVTGWSCSGRRQSRCPQVMCIHDQRSTQHFYSTMINILHNISIQTWSTFYATIFSIQEQRSTQHFSPIMINVLHYTYLNPRTTLYKTLFYNHDQRFTLHFSQTMINPTLTLHIYDPSIPSTEVYVLWKVWAQSKSNPTIHLIEVAIKKYYYIKGW